LAAIAAMARLGVTAATGRPHHYKCPRPYQLHGTYIGHDLLAAGRPYSSRWCLRRPTSAAPSSWAPLPLTRAQARCPPARSRTGNGEIAND
jgi:hypothetical protein